MKAVITIFIFFLPAFTSAQTPITYLHADERPFSLELNSAGPGQLILKLRSWDQIDSIPPLAPILDRAMKDLKPVWDTVYNKGNSHMVKYYLGKRRSNFYITKKPYQNQGFITDTAGRVSEMQLGADTLQLQFYTTGRQKGKMPFIPSEPYEVMLVFKSLEDLTVLSNTSLPTDLDSLKRRLNNDPDFRKKSTVYASVDTTRTIWSIKKYGREGNNFTEFNPDIYAGFQFVRGEWITSAAAGFQLMHGSPWGERRVYKLLWEPHFSFSRDDKGKRKLNRDDFISFRYYIFEKDPDTKKVSFPTFFAIGYLVRNKGDVYEKNTIKFSLPGLQYMGATLEPEFFFNDFFRNFSPSVKLNFHFD